MDTERVMERVRRLLAIANDPAASDNEQRIALEQAQRLMDRHAIEEWQLEEDHDAIEIIRRMIHLEANPCNWYMAELANIVALGNRCRASYGWRRAGNGRNVVCSISIFFDLCVSFTVLKPINGAERLSLNKRTLYHIF